MQGRREIPPNSRPEQKHGEGTSTRGSPSGRSNRRKKTTTSTCNRGGKNQEEGRRHNRSEGWQLRHRHHHHTRGILNRATRGRHISTIDCRICYMKFSLENSTIMCKCEMDEAGLTVTKDHVKTLQGSTYKVKKMTMPQWMKPEYAGEMGTKEERKTIRNMAL